MEIPQLERRKSSASLQGKHEKKIKAFLLKINIFVATAQKSALKKQDYISDNSSRLYFDNTFIHLKNGIIANVLIKTLNLPSFSTLLLVDLIFGLM